MIHEAMNVVIESLLSILEHLTLKKCCQFLILSTVISLLIYFSLTDYCPPPPCALCPPPAPPAPPSYSCDPPGQIKLADPCAGGDCFCSASPYAHIYIASKEGLQKRTTEGKLLRILPVSDLVTISCLASDDNRNLYATFEESNRKSVFDTDGNLVKGIGNKHDIAEQILSDRSSNLYVLTDGGNALVKYDKNGNFLSTHNLPEPVTCIDLNSDQCSIMYSNPHGEIRSFALCNKLIERSKSQPLKIEQVNSMKVFQSGDIIDAQGTDMLRNNSSAIFISVHDFPAHDNWAAMLKTNLFADVVNQL